MAGACMTHWLKTLAHWLTEPVHHKHYYRYEAFQDHEGRIFLHWKCVYLLCGDERPDEEYVNA